MKQYRVFIGIRVSDEIGRFVAEWSKQFQSLIPSWVPPENFHVTLVPPWEEHDHTTTIQKITEAVADFAQFELRFHHFQCAPQPTAPKMIWMLVDGSKELSALRERLMKAVHQTDEQLFVPHVTIARFDGQRIERSTEYAIKKHLNLIQPITEIILYRSPDHRDGNYHILARIPLSAGML